jgi:hypothetical protein
LNEGYEQLVKSKEKEEFKLTTVITYQQGNTKCDEEVDDCEHELDHNDPGKMLVEQVAVLSYIPVVEIGDSKVKEDIEKE